MSKRSEVELGDDEGHDDYEMVPVGPIRKLERRIDEMQEQAQQNAGGSNDELIRDVLDIMKSNQKIVNDMTESTHELKNEVEDLTHKMDEVVDNMNSFMDLLHEASEMDMEGEMVGDMEGRIADAIGNKMDDVAQDIQSSNEEVINHLQNINNNLRQAGMAQGGGRQQRSGNAQSRQQNNSGGQSSERVRQLKERFGSGNGNNQNE
ncbi:hypothetical protein GKQ38_03025 [Candidatus Nanohaloarchaea archaeon]|nr:hypothetical protein GKQ38_03025 [Candidatus Nanohaloarchaea archaeon]